MPKYPEDFVHRGKTIEFHYATGEVIGTNKFSETHVSSSGGGGTVGGYVGPHGGNVGGSVSAPVIRSTAVTNHEFWIRTDEGKEIPIKLKGVDIPIREGQRITIVSANRKNREELFAVVNHNDERYYYINDQNILNYIFGLEWSAIKSLFLYTIFSVVALWAIYYSVEKYTDFPSRITYEHPIFVLACAVFILVGVWILVSKPFKIHRFKKKFQRYLDGILQFAFRELGNPPQFTARDALRAAASAQAKAQASGQSGALNINIDNM